MRRLALLVALAVLATGACNSHYDRYLPKFGRQQVVAKPNGPVVFTVAPHGEIVYAELRTFDLYAVRVGGEPELLVHLDVKPDSLAVTPAGGVFAAGRDHTHHLRIWFAASLGAPHEVQDKFQRVIAGPASRFPVHLRVMGAHTLIVGHSHSLYSIEPGQPYAKRRVISRGWTDPVFAFGRGNRIWVADNAVPGQKERLARGRDRSVSHRNRFASVMPPYTNPSGMVRLDDELLLCSRTHHKVYRLHIGLDEVARWRGQMDGLSCDRDIGVLPDGSVVAAQTSVIYKYPPR